MSKLVIEPHYLGSIEYFCLITKYDELLFEVCDSFPKQTYRNRALILGSNKVVPLIIPLSFANGTPTKEVRINYSQRWIKDHWGAIYSAYGKAPYFDFFADHLNAAWNIKHRFLVDLIVKMMELPKRLLGKEQKINFTETFEKQYDSEYKDYRNYIRPKIDFPDRNIYQPIAYSQLFGNSFVPNLSIVDLIMCEGPRVDEWVQLSSRLEG